MINLMVGLDYYRVLWWACSTVVSEAYRRVELHLFLQSEFANGLHEVLLPFSLEIYTGRNKFC